MDREIAYYFPSLDEIHVFTAETILNSFWVDYALLTGVAVYLGDV